MKLPPEMAESDSGKHILIRIHVRWVPTWWPYGWNSSARVWIVPFYVRAAWTAVREWLR